MMHRAPNANPGAQYLEIAQHYRTAIDSGALKPGQRLPIISKIAEKFGVSRSTAHKALLQLNREGYVYGTQSGSHVLRGGPSRAFSLLTETLNELEGMDQHLNLMPEGGIVGRDGAVVRDTESGTWKMVDVA